MKYSHCLIETCFINVNLSTYQRNSLKVNLTAILCLEMSSTEAAQLNSTQAKVKAKAKVNLSVNSSSWVWRFRGMFIRLHSFQIQSTSKHSMYYCLDVSFKMKIHLNNKKIICPLNYQIVFCFFKLTLTYWNVWFWFLT